MSKLIWIPREDALGEIAVDLAKCERFVLQQNFKAEEVSRINPGVNTDQYEHPFEVVDSEEKEHGWFGDFWGSDQIFYLTPDNRWLRFERWAEGDTIVEDPDGDYLIRDEHYEDTGKWTSAEYHLTEPPDVIEEMKDTFVSLVPPLWGRVVPKEYEKFDLIQPIVAARYLHQAIGKLPEELKDFLVTVSDSEAYSQVMWNSTGPAEPDALQSPLRPRWNRSAKLLSVSKNQSFEYHRLGKRKTVLLDAFEAHGWPECIPSPIEHPDTLDQTIRDFNRSKSNKDCPLKFSVSKKGVHWKIMPKVSH